jgi:deoxyribonuclease-4
MRLGFHVSIAGGFKNVIARAQERQCETLQVFSRNPRGWKYGTLDNADIELFRKQLADHDIRPIFVHLPYLPNLASSETGLFQKSLDSLVEDLLRCTFIGAPFLIMHVGSNPEGTLGLRQISQGINQALSRVKSSTRLLLENTAGQGHELGSTFEQIRSIIDRVEDKKRIGVVFDTAHAFAAGYDLRTKSAVADTFRKFHRIIGLGKLYLVHLNDSKAEYGSHRDRHWHIAQGNIGMGMYHILHHAALEELPFIMETPRTNLKEDLMNMKKVRQLLDQQ